MAGLARFSGNGETPAIMSDHFAHRDRPLAAVANFVLRRCSHEYQAIIQGAVVYGLEAAARDGARRPFAQVIRDELRARGWRVLVPVGESQGAPPYLSPDGVRFPNLSLAAQDQIDRELRDLAQGLKEPKQ